jgi:hypothetical protein
MKIYGIIEKAQLENSASDLSGALTGLIFINTTEKRVKFHNGTGLIGILANDDKCVIGTNGTANNNVRLNRAANEVLQVVKGGDTTAEGSYSTNHAQLSFLHETYTDGAKPAAGKAGRVAWITDLLELQVDNGTAWTSIGGKGGIATKSADATLSAAEFKNGFIKLNGSAAAVGITLPAAADVSGYSCVLKCIDTTNTCSIVTNVDGASYNFLGENDYIKIISDGTNFYRIG